MDFLGMQLTENGTRHYEGLVKTELARYGQIIKDNNIKVE